MLLRSQLLIFRVRFQIPIDQISISSVPGSPIKIQKISKYKELEEATFNIMANEFVVWSLDLFGNGTERFTEVIAGKPCFKGIQKINL